MAETALNFGPDWLRALAHGSSTSTSQPPPSNLTTIPKYSLAQYRYGREEMLALIPKDPKKPDCLQKDTSKIVKESFSLPLALTPHTEDEQRLWARSINSDAVLRASGKSVPGNNMGRNRGGSVDRGRGRGRGGYYQRGITYEDTDDGPPSSFSRPKPIERSQSANEKDQRWDDKDRRFDRSYSGPRGSWRNPVDKERRDIERNPSSRSLNGNSRNSHSQQKTSGNHLPEWSVDESDEQDVVGTFDSSGAFLEPKMTDNCMDDIYVSDEADEGPVKDSPEAKREVSKKNSKSKSAPQMNISVKQCVKQTELKSKTDELMVEKHPSKICEPQTNSKTVSTAVTADNVITTSVQHYVVNNNQSIVNLPNVPDIKSTKNETVLLNHAKNSEASVPSAALEEDTFAHHKKATENMVAQWTEEEEQKVISQTAAPLQEKDNRWYYQDPQGEIQGPFTSPEMLEWFSAGYFTMSLMVRRAFDEKFSQLGDLIKSWGRVPFMPGNSPPPIRATPTSLPIPVTQTIVPNPVAAPVSNQLPKQEDQLLAIQQQLLQQQLMQQQLMLRQAQLQQLLAQLKQQDNFTSLNTQQQQQVLMQQFMAQQQMPRPNVSEQPGLVETMTPLPLPLLGLPMAPLLKNDLSLWNMTPPSNPWPLNVNVSQPSGTSIWDIDSKQNSEETELEKQKRLVKEQQEQLRKVEEERLAQEKEMEEKRKLEELRRKEEEERHLKELQKQEEEKKKLEEQKRREEEKRRQEELRKIEEQKRKEEELKKQREEELRRIEEQKRLEELKRQEEQKRLEELMRKEEEERRQAELRKQEEQRKLEEKKRKEEHQKKIELEKERERIELEKQKEAARLKEIEREQQLQKERERQRQKEKEEEMRRLAEIKLKSQGPAWGIQKTQSETQLSLTDIQRLQEEKEREEREERLRQQQLQQQAIKHAQQNKNSLSWAKRSAESQPAVKSLAEIQQEEAERLIQQQRSQKSQAPPPVINSNVGVWGNASHLNRITAAPPSWNINNVTTSGFWDDAVSSSQTRKQNSKTNDSAFPALINPEKPATTVVHSNKSKNVRAKKEEQDAITKLYGNRKPTDEFTAWCTEALSAMPSSVDVPTFVAFLKDIESPYEVHDYVRSYLGDGKEPREFAKQFLDKRSKFRAKQVPAEENTLWGPAPAVNPVVNKSLISQPLNDSDGNSNAKGKSKRRKNRMQKMDNSMLGFTVQSNPDRLNVGEIDHVEGM